VRSGGFLAFLLLLAATPALAQAPTAPHVSLTSEQAVRAQMEALTNNNDPYDDHGIEVVWRFASSENKVFTGPLGRFKQMMRGPVYGPMTGHRSAAYEIIFADSGEAVIDVILRTPGGAFAGYRFRLSRKKGGRYDACWMTDAVVPIEVTSI